jgi:uncharacterized surface protein with fasciclin (FAS1) repeats
MPKRALPTVLSLAAAAAFAVPAQAQMAAHGGHAMTDAPGDIVDVAVANGSFTSLVAAVKAAGLVETLKGEGPFTVFAPTDEAFAALPEGTVESLLKPENRDMLTAILTYHVVPGKVLASDVVKLSSATTVEGSSVDIEVKEGSVFVDGAKVIQADVPASNGVIHVIDKVILPSD